MLNSSELSKLVAEITGQDENHLYSEISQLSGSSKIRVALQRLRNRIRDLESRRVVLITDVSGDEVLIETDIPQEAIEDWCRTNNKDLENRENIFLARTPSTSTAASKTASQKLIVRRIQLGFAISSTRSGNPH